VQEAGVDDPVQATVTMPRAAFLGLLFAGRSPIELIQSGVMKIEGDVFALQALTASFDPAGPMAPFGIVTP
jgi:alkyl sulfatase BDS1-like metallo-beta-lactamase superfamily hydrolase